MIYNGIIDHKINGMYNKNKEIYIENRIFI